MSIIESLVESHFQWNQEPWFKAIKDLPVELRHQIRHILFGLRRIFPQQFGKTRGLVRWLRPSSKWSFTEAGDAMEQVPWGQYPSSTGPTRWFMMKRYPMRTHVINGVFCRAPTSSFHWVNLMRKIMSTSPALLALQDIRFLVPSLTPPLPTRSCHLLQENVSFLSHLH